MLTAVKRDYGLGWGLASTEGRKSFGHGGANEGFRCNVFAYADSDRGVAVMANGDNGAALGNELVRARPDYKGREKEVVKVDPAKLNEYAGRFKLPEGIVVAVTVEGGELYVAALGNKVRMLPESPDSFFDVDDQAPSIRFVKDADGTVELHTAGVVGKRM